MSNNKSYRIRTNISSESSVNLQVNQDYDMLEILSLKIDTENVYKLHSSKYGCVVGRVLANGGVGVPNAKISIFIEANEETTEDDILYSIYPYTTTSSKNIDGIRYNLLPDEQITTCHQQVGTFPNKRLVLDDKNTLEIFDTYYKYTTVSNDAGDYMMFGVPVGNQSIHVDIDLSDIGFLSQKPIDMLYKGYNIGQFENAQQFKKDTNLSVLPQLVTQNTNVFVNSFWGDEGEGEISITRHDIDVDYKFEPTCIFMGSLITDNNSNGFSKKCVPTPEMGRMEELVTGSGTIEMIRKKADGTVEEFAVNGTQLIDGNGTWCYQIPMNLDYVTTDEYGNLVPSENPEKGLPTRTKVRFRVSLSDFDSDYSNNHLVKVLVPNNPQLDEKGNLIPDYVFGTFTKEESFKDLLWNNVYTVKSFIPRIQKGNYQRNKKFSGIKNINVSGANSPIPYNNMRVDITFLFRLQCAIVKALFKLARFQNRFTCFLLGLTCSKKKAADNEGGGSRCVSFGDGLCPDAENFYYAPDCGYNIWGNKRCGGIDIMKRTLDHLSDDNADVDPQSTDKNNSDGNEKICLASKSDFFIQCVEINLAMENNVIQFDFYNDWINGLLYIPRWFVKIRKKGSFLFGLIKIKEKIRACNDDFDNTRRYTQQCAIDYQMTKNTTNIFSTNASYKGCNKKGKQKCHKTGGRKYVKIFGKKGGIVHTETNMHDLKVYYAKPSEKVGESKCNLFATDIVLLGSISNENIWGIPNEFDGMTTSTYQMPPNLAHTNMDSSGVLYAAHNGHSKCTENGASDIKKVGDAEAGQTFEDYKKWAATEEFNADDDVTEYAVTEMSGIDWGFSGPNQGANNFNKLYQPGGHFLGIGCTNAEVNIKSCINLSRICEVGSTMSQRQSELAKKGETSYDYEYIIPSGLISKLELGDTNYRTIFATLNHNRLKTVVNEKGITKYDFISVNPINYGGELTNETNNDRYIASRNDNALTNSVYNAKAYVKTIEDTSSDYYYFRMGINAEDPTLVKTADVKKRYLINNGSKLALPVYENSFYFYFGLKDGSTALNRFMTDYYAACPNLNNEREALINEIDVEDIIICNRGATVEVKLENADMIIPYRVVLVTPNDILRDLAKNQISTRGFVIGEDELREVGTYEIMLKNDREGLSISKQFYVDAVLPLGNSYNLYGDSYKISFENMILENDVNVDNKNKITLTSVFEGMIESTDDTSISNGGTISIELPKYNGELKPPYPIGVIVSCGGYSAYKSVVDIGNEDIKKIIVNYVEEYEKNLSSVVFYNGETLFDGYESETRIKLIAKAWYEGDYTVKILYSCKEIEQINNDGSLGVYDIGSQYIEVLYKPYSMYIYDETVRLDKLVRASAISWQNARKTPTNGAQTFSSDFSRGEITRSTGNTTKPRFIGLDNSILSEYDKWKLKKSLTFNTSKYVRGSKSLTVGTINGTPGIKDLTHGNAVIFNEETEKYETKTFYDASQAIEEGGTLNKEEMILPSEGWFGNYHEFKPLGVNTTSTLVTYAAEEDAEEFMPYFGNFGLSSYEEGVEITNGDCSEEGSNFIPEDCDYTEMETGCENFDTDSDCVIFDPNYCPMFGEINNGCEIPGEGGDEICLSPGIDGGDNGCDFPGLDDETCTCVPDGDENPDCGCGEDGDDYPDCGCGEDGDEFPDCGCGEDGDDYPDCGCGEDGDDGPSY